MINGLLDINMTKPNYILFLVLIVIASCGNDDIQKINIMTQNKALLPVEVGENVLINYTDSGRIRAKVYAPVLKRFATEERNETEMPKGITVYFISKLKKVESSLKARYALRYERDRKMVAKNDVVVVNVKGDTLRTELLNWDEAKQLIYTDKFVRITTPDEIITGTGFESNAEFTKYKISKISGTFDLAK